MALCGLRAGSGTAVPFSVPPLSRNACVPSLRGRPKGRKMESQEDRNHRRGCLSFWKPFPPSADGEIPARKGRIANATRVHRITVAKERAVAHGRRIAYATRVHRRTAAEEWPAAQQRRIASQLGCTGQRVQKNGLLPYCYGQKIKTEEKLLPFCTNIYLTICEKSWYNKTLYKIGRKSRFLSIC